MKRSTTFLWAAVSALSMAAGGPRANDDNTGRGGAEAGVSGTGSSYDSTSTTTPSGRGMTSDSGATRDSAMR
jgi:hypothetical protein